MTFLPQLNTMQVFAGGAGVYNFTVPAGVTMLIAEGWGSGSSGSGGGSGSGNGATPGGGGGGQAGNNGVYQVASMRVVPGEVLVITIGAGGAGGAGGVGVVNAVGNDGVAGNPGTDTTIVGSLMTLRIPGARKSTLNTTYGKHGTIAAGGAAGTGNGNDATWVGINTPQGGIFGAQRDQQGSDGSVGASNAAGGGGGDGGSGRGGIFEMNAIQTDRVAAAGTVGATAVVWVNPASDPRGLGLGFTRPQGGNGGPGNVGGAGAVGANGQTGGKSTGGGGGGGGGGVTTGGTGGSGGNGGNGGDALVVLYWEQAA